MGWLLGAVGIINTEGAPNPDHPFLPLRDSFEFLLYEGECPRSTTKRKETGQSLLLEPPREGGQLRRLGARSLCYCCLDPIPH